MSFTCPRCGRTSHNPEDARHGWCGACNDQTADVFPPCPIADQQPRELSLTGYAVAMHATGQPVLMHIRGAEEMFALVWETRELLEANCEVMRIPYGKSMQITDGPEFVASIPRDIRIAVNLRPHDDPEKRKRGNLRFTEVLRG